MTDVFLKFKSQDYIELNTKFYAFLLNNILSYNKSEFLDLFKIELV